MSQSELCCSGALSALCPNTSRISEIQSGVKLQMHAVLPWTTVSAERREDSGSRAWYHQKLQIYNSCAYRWWAFNMHPCSLWYLMINLLALSQQSCLPLKWKPTATQPRALLIWKAKKQTSEMWPMALLWKSRLQQKAVKTRGKESFFPHTLRLLAFC